MICRLFGVWSWTINPKHFTGNQKLLWCQLCRDCLHWRLSMWHVVPPVTSKLASRRLSVNFSQISWLLVIISSPNFKPLRSKFFRGNINMYLHFVSFLKIETTQVVEILPQIRQEPTNSTWSITWLLMSWRRKEPGHQQPWYWPS